LSLSGNGQKGTWFDIQSSIICSQKQCTGVDAKKHKDKERERIMQSIFLQWSPDIDM
jgi:hypothetical protein